MPHPISAALKALSIQLKNWKPNSDGMVSFLPDSRSYLSPVPAEDHDIATLHEPKTEPHLVPTLFGMVLVFCWINNPGFWKPGANLLQFSGLSRRLVNWHRMRIVKNHAKTPHGIIARRSWPVAVSYFRIMPLGGRVPRVAPFYLGFSELRRGHPPSRIS